MKLPEHNILGLKVNPLSMNEVAAFVKETVREKAYARIVTLNAEIAYLSQNDSTLKEIINDAQLVTPDGSGILWASERYGFPIQERVSGIDLMQRLLTDGKKEGYRFFFLGARREVVMAAVAKAKFDYPGITIVGWHDGYFSEEEASAIAEQVKESGANILFVAMGFPKQDLWIDTYAKAAGISVAMGVGGSFDVLSGNIKRAPDFWQKMRLEWFYRLVKDPSRYKRVLNLPKFMSAVKKDVKKS